MKAKALRAEGLGATPYTVNFIAGKDYESNLAPIAGKFMEKDKDSILSLPVGSNILIRGRNGDYALDNDIGLGANYKGIWVNKSFGDDHQIKFVVGHELGHAVGALWAKMIGSNYNLNPPPTQILCTCSHWGNSSHCLQSKEYVRTAENEGFAHFISTALFNDRIYSHAWFGYTLNSQKLPMS